MLKNILKLEGAQKLTATEQKELIGGKAPETVGNCGGYTIVYAYDAAACLRNDLYYRPQYIGANKCSLMVAPC
ncbi:hypothetical protein HNQ02_002685 [Flavobacterium sp. 7E]|uniref:hypothetical protein n=1 Tax=Flavobacterium sp. 7E TaxID=2735898 RepID=UPI00156EBE5D|nr:hypothetical protein [Flavobacterium sp. 7E]NRS89753.1 hypothetical protein [Flavobacterium sp. 7E]